MLQIFDSWAGMLEPEHYARFSLKYISRICDAIEEVPVTVFAKGAWFALKEMNGLRCQTIGLDWNMNPQDVRQLLPEKTLQGNLDPCALYGSFKEIKKKNEKYALSVQRTTHRQSRTRSIS